MSLPRCFGSPLAGTAVVLAMLGLLAVPLHRLTSARPARVAKATPPAAHAGKTPAVLRVKLLAPAKRLVVASFDGDVLIESADMPAGETEHDVELVLSDEGADLALTADFTGYSGETAVFLTLMPDGYEEQTRYATGSGTLQETLRYDWHHSH